MAIEPELELAIDGVFTDITPDAYFEDGINQTAGASAEGSETDSTVVDLRLKSPDGKYSNRNPNSPYYGKIGRNTQMRASVGGAAATMLLPLDQAQSRASTPDTAALDITGDIDIRADLSPDQWAGDLTGNYQELVTKFDFNGNQRSWGFLIDEDGRPYFTWSEDGIALKALRADAAVSFTPRARGAVRVTLDVNNGGGGHTANFYVSDTIDGEWTQLGNTMIGSGVTSIFSSSAPLEVGNSLNGFAVDGMRRRIHAVQVRSSIGGVTVANPVFLGQPVGTTSFADSTGKTWTLSGGAAITDRRSRFVVEASEWQPVWEVGADDVNTPIVGGGLMRRLTQGESPLDSTLRRRIPSFNPVAYWPMEDGENALEAASAIPGNRPLRVSGFTFQSDGTLGGSRAMPEVSPGSIMRANLTPGVGQYMPEYTVQMVYRYTSTRPVTDAEFLSWRSTGTIKRWRILMRNGVATVEGYDVVGDTPAFTQSIAVGDDVWDDFVRFRFTVEQSGGTVNWRLTFVNIGSGGGSMSNSFAGLAGQVSEIHTTFGATIADGRLIVGHLSVIQETDPALDPYNFADHGYTGERAADRMVRLAEEEGMPLRIVGPQDVTPEMGPQEIDTFLGVLRSCEAVDGGVLYEDPDRLGLIYRTRNSKYRQTPALVIPYSKLVQPLEPTDDDQLTRNEITRSRIEGSSTVVRQETGPMSVELPPLGVGRYTDSQDVNVELDGQLEQIAGWALHRGTWDEARYKKITILLHKHPELIEQVAEMQIGDLIQITDTPEFLPPGPINLILEGFSEDITGLTWVLVMNCSPGGIWSVGIADNEIEPVEDNGNRADTSGSTLLAGVTDSAKFLITESVGAPWINTTDYSLQFPFSVTLGGEQVTVEEIRGVLEDDFNRTVSNSWGLASDGRTWIETGGLASDRSVNGSAGVISLPATPGTWRIQRTGLTLVDCETLARFSMAQVHTGASYDYCTMLRRVSDTDFYVVRASFTTSGTVQMRIFTNDDGTLGPTVTTPWTYVANQEFYMRSRVDGQRIRGRIWPVSAREPDYWDVDQTAVAASTNLNGDVGVLCFAGAGLTSANPSSSTTEFRITDPQLFTVGLREDDVDDTFGLRTAANGWGVAESGQTWTTSGGPAADYAVTGGVAVHSASTRNMTRHTIIPSASADCDVVFDWEIAELPVSEDAFVFPFVRYLDPSNMYLNRLEIKPTGVLNMTLRKRFGGTETMLGTGANAILTVVPLTRYRVRLQVVGSILRTKLWRAVDPEPSAWALSIADTSLTAAGSVGCRTFLDNATTNVLPYVFTFDNFTSTAIVSGRSRNGIVKAHDAGTNLSLTYPARAAL